MFTKTKETLKKVASSMTVFAAEFGLAAVGSLIVIPAVLTYPVHWILRKCKVPLAGAALAWLFATLYVTVSLPTTWMLVGTAMYGVYKVGSCIYNLFIRKVK